MLNAVLNELRKRTQIRHTHSDEPFCPRYDAAKAHAPWRTVMSVFISLTLVCGLLPIIPRQSYADETVSSDAIAQSAQISEDEIVIVYQDEVLDLDEEVATTSTDAEDRVADSAEDVDADSDGEVSNSSDEQSTTTASAETTLQECGVVDQEEVTAATDDKGAVAVAQLEEGVSTEGAIEALESVEGIASVQPNYRYSLLTTTTSDMYATSDTTAEYNQYYLAASGITDAWDYAQAEGSVTIATIDTGCNLQHEDLQGVVDTEHAYDVTTNSLLAAAGVANNGDANGHGTLVAGVLAAQANNGIGIAGASYNATIVPIKVFDDNDQCTTAQLIAAYEYLDGLLDQGELSSLHVINMSLGYYASGDDQADDALRAVIADMRDEHNVLTVCAGGNGTASGEARTATCYPSDFDECLSVTALNEDGSVARFSDYNAAKDISAAGVNVLSTTATGGYATATGTSMAAPQVSAAAALLWAVDSSLTTSQVVDALTNTADSVEGMQADNGSAGSLNAAAAVASVLGISLDDEQLADGDGAAEATTDDETTGSTTGTDSTSDDATSDASGVDGAADEKDAVDSGSSAQEGDQESDDSDGTTNDLSDRSVVTLDDDADAATSSDSTSTNSTEADDNANSWRYTNGELLSEDLKQVQSILPLAAANNAYSCATWYASNKTTSYTYKATPTSSKSTVKVSGVKKVGIDVSHHNGTINWKKAKADGISFAIIRCGYGSNFTAQDDTQFLANVKGALANDIEIGIYLYSYATKTTGSDSSATSEAQHVIRLLKAAGLDPSKVTYPIFLDMEDKSQAALVDDASNKTTGRKLLGSIATTFCNALEAEGYTVGIYANKNWWDTYLTDSAFSNETWVKWVARYPVSKLTSSGVDGVDMWQFSDCGNVSGVGGLVDVNFDYTYDYVGNSVVRATTSSVATQVYSGKALTPSPTVKLKGKTLVKGTDYTLSYKNNTNVGTATITITGIGNYTGTKTVTFKIAKSLSSATVSSVSSKTYTGAAIKPTPTVKVGSTTLKNGTDYTLSYKNNKSVGTATITITGKGSYTGTKSVTFKITKASLSKATIASIGTKTYTGKALKPTPTVKLSGNKLTTADYTVSYKNNTKTGTATVTIKGKGNCSGSKSITFKIKPAKVTSVSVKSTSKGKITVKWSNTKGKAAGVTGYKIVVKYGSKTIKTQYVSGKSAKSKTVSVSSKYRGKKVKVYVYAYKTINKSKVCSAASSVKTVKVKK